MKRSFLSLLVFCLCFSFSFSGVQAEVNNEGIPKTSTENEIQKEETNITNESSTNEQETVKIESKEKEISSNELKEYFIVFKDEIIPNVGKKKKEILKEKKIKWKGLLKSEKVETIEEFDNFPILIVKMTKKQAEKLSKDKTIDFLVEKENFDKNFNAKPTAQDISEEEKSTNENYLSDIKAPELWNQGFKGDGVKIAILDTGIRATHPELEDSFIKGTNCTVAPCTTETDTTSYIDYTGHGTHIAGIISGSHSEFGMNGEDVKGIAPNSDIYVAKVAQEILPIPNAAIYIDGDNVFRAIDWAINENVHIINMSFELSLQDEDVDNLNDRLFRAYNDRTTIEHGILLIASAGNEGYTSGSGLDTVNYPANNDQVIAVSNVRKYSDFYYLYEDQKDGVTVGSSAGPAVELTAPGFQIMSSYVSDDYHYLTGTSMAAPVVVGVAALLKEKYPNNDARSLRFILREMAHVGGQEMLKGLKFTNPEDSNRTYEYGYGLVQAEVGKSIENTILPFDYKNYNIYDLPNEEFITTDTYIGGSIAAPIRFFRDEKTGDTYFELETNKGYRWIEDNNYNLYNEKEFSNYLELKNKAPLYEFPEYDEKHQGEFITEIKSDTRFIKTTKKWTDSLGKIWYKIKYKDKIMWIKESDVVQLKGPNFQLEEFKTNLTLEKDKTILYNLPYNGELSFTTLDAEVVETTQKFVDEYGNLWFEIITSSGKLWTNTTNFDSTEPILMTIGNNDNLYDNKNGNLLSEKHPLGTTVVYKKSDDWYQVYSPQGLTWIKPKEIYAGKFPLTIEYSSLGGSSNQKNIYFYDAPNGNVTGIANIKANEPNDTTTKFPLTFQAFQKNSSWYEVLYDNTKQWVNTNKGYIGSFQIQLTSPETKLFDEVSTSPIENGLTLEPQIVTVKEHYYTGAWNSSFTGVDFTPWFKVDTVWGEKWIIYNEIDTISEEL